MSLDEYAACILSRAKSAGDMLLGMDVLGRRSTKRNFAAFKDSRRNFGFVDFTEGLIPTGVVDLAGDSCDESVEGDRGSAINVEVSRSLFSCFIDLTPADVCDVSPDVFDGVLPIRGEPEVSEAGPSTCDAFNWPCWADSVCATLK